MKLAGSELGCTPTGLLGYTSLKPTVLFISVSAWRLDRWLFQTIIQYNIQSCKTKLEQQGNDSKQTAYSTAVINISNLYSYNIRQSSVYIILQLWSFRFYFPSIVRLITYRQLPGFPTRPRYIWISNLWNEINITLTSKHW